MSDINEIVFELRYRCNDILSVEKYLNNIDGVIFDLDDTLYSEKDYVKSGYKAIAKQFPEIKDVDRKLWDAFLKGEKAIDSVFAAVQMEEKKEEALNVYREHMPTITLYEGVKDMLYRIRKSGKKIGIITDGRPEGQRNKLKALDLNKVVDDIIITDELGGIQFRKPNDISFRIMQNRWLLPYKQIIYVGDNLNKDFQAPRQLGMKYIYFENQDGLYFNNKK